MLYCSMHRQVTGSGFVTFYVYQLQIELQSVSRDAFTKNYLTWLLVVLSLAIYGLLISWSQNVSLETNLSLVAFIHQ